MGINVIPPKFATPRVISLTSGSSWTVPAGVKFVNVTLFGGGGGGGGAGNVTSGMQAQNGAGGQSIKSNLSTTPGASISYTIGAGGTAGAAGNNNGGDGGTTTFTGATSALGGSGGNAAQNSGLPGTTAAGNNNGGMGANSTGGTNNAGGAGGSGWIEVEYWVA